jgi:hypothetical protein
MRATIKLYNHRHYGELLKHIQYRQGSGVGELGYVFLDREYWDQDM